MTFSPIFHYFLTPFNAFSMKKVYFNGYWLRVLHKNEVSVTAINHYLF